MPSSGNASCKIRGPHIVWVPIEDLYFSRASLLNGETIFLLNWKIDFYKKLDSPITFIYF